MIKRLCTKESSHRFSATEALKHPWITRKLDEKPPLTKFERKDMLGEELMIETKFRKVRQIWGGYYVTEYYLFYFHYSLSYI